MQRCSRSVVDELVIELVVGRPSLTAIRALVSLT